MGRAITIKGRTDMRSYSEIQSSVEVRRTPTKAERAVIWNKLAKRYLRSKGLIGPKIPSKWNWEFNGLGGQVEGHCRSDARKAIKNELGISRDERLPVEVVIKRVRL